jgi:hypothetical protein
MMEATDIMKLNRLKIKIIKSNRFKDPLILILQMKNHLKCSRLKRISSSNNSKMKKLLEGAVRDHL